jgi:hypothetical protein
MLAIIPCIPLRSMPICYVFPVPKVDQMSPSICGHSYEEVQTPLKDVIFAPVIFLLLKKILEHFFFDNCGLHKTHLLRNVFFYASAVHVVGVLLCL